MLGSKEGKPLICINHRYNRPITIIIRNRNIKTSKALLESQAHQGTSLFTALRRIKGGSREAQVRFPERISGGDRVVVKVGVVQVEKVNDQMGQGRSVHEEMTF